MLEWCPSQCNNSSIEEQASLEPRYRSNTDRELRAEWLGPSSRDITTTLYLTENSNKVDWMGEEVTFQRIIQVIADCICSCL